MNIEELADRFRKEIPEGLDDERFLKAVYIKLGKERVFDEKYYFGNSATMKKIYTLAKRNKDNKHYATDKRKIVCYSLSYVIQHLLTELGYRCVVSPSFEVGDHVFPIVQLKDGRKIKFDLQQDLENIQTYCKTRYFATVDSDDIGYNFDTIDDETQVSIDKDIGYIESEEDYKDIAIQQLQESLSENRDLTIWQRLSILLSDPKVNDIPMDTGYIECFKFYKKRLFPKFFSDKELAGKIHLITCSKEDPQSPDEQEYTNCIYVNDKSAPKSVYLFSRVHNKYILTSYDNVIKIQEEGLNIGAKYPSNGATKLKKALKEYQLEKTEGHTEH